MPLFSLSSVGSSSILPASAPTDAPIAVRIDARLDNSLADSSSNGLTGSDSGVSFSTSLPPTGTHSLVVTNIDSSTTKVFVDFDNVPAPNAATPGITVALWLRITGVATSNASNIASVVFDIGPPASGGTNGGFALLRSANQVFDADGLDDKNYTIRGSTTTIKLRDNVWQHLVFTTNRDSQTINWFRNGVAMTSITDGQTANYPAVVGGAIGKVRIGHSGTRTDVRGLIGQVDRFVLYNGAINSASAAALVAELSQVNDMTVYYDFNTAYTGNNASDTGTVFRNVATGSTDAAKSATLRNSCVVDINRIKYGRASLGNTDTVDSYSRCTAGITLAAGQHTFSMWFRLAESTFATGVTRHMMVWTNGSYETKGVGVGVRRVAGSPSSTYNIWILSDGASVEGLPVYSSGTTASALAIDTWYHVVAVFTTSDPTNASCQVYLDGNAQVKNIFSSPIDTTARIYRDFMVRIGRGYTYGNIDDFRYFPRGITSSELTTLYTKTSV